jgi:hypothetical protein
MVHSEKLTIVTDDNYQTDVGFALGKTIRFGRWEFIAERFGSRSLSTEGNDSGVVFVRMAHNGLSSLHTILKESTNEGETASSGWGSSGLSPK